jgi:SAM-dependent methyltransferase
MTPRDFLVKLIWGNKAYSVFMAPFDRYTVDVRPSGSFPGGALALNKLCRASDARTPAWARGYADLGFPPDPGIFHRKIWEFNQVLYGLRALGRLTPAATALGIGCGHEELMYFLATRLRSVTATDLYRGGYLGDEGVTDVLDHPVKYAPFRYPEERLRVLRMDALDLRFEDSSFDIVFCLSALEHFGSAAKKLRALREMRRVLKPGGVAALTTELILNRLGWRRDFFKAEALSELVAEAGFTLSGPLDLAIEEEYARPPVAFPHEVFRTPHVVVRLFHTIFTSLSLFLLKPDDPAAPARALTGAEDDAPPAPWVYRAALRVVEAPERVAAAAGFRVTLDVRNEGDAIWFRNSSRTHRVRVGVWALGEDGRNLTGEPLRFALPRDLKPGEDARLEIDLPPLREKGSLRLRIDLVKEYYFWFGDRGSPSLTLPVVSA